MRISITLEAPPHSASEFDVSDFIPASYRLRFKLSDDAAPERLHELLGGAGYSARTFALRTETGVTFYGCRISTETGREVGVDFQRQG